VEGASSSQHNIDKRSLGLGALAPAGSPPCPVEQRGGPGASARGRPAQNAGDPAAPGVLGLVLAPNAGEWPRMPGEPSPGDRPRPGALGPTQERKCNRLSIVDVQYSNLKERDS